MAITIHLSTLKLLQKKRSVSEVESSSQELLKHSLKIAKLQSGNHIDEKEGTSIDDEFTKQKLITL